MFVEHDEARTMWCPMVRCLHLSEDVISNCSINDIGQKNWDYARCIGSECMMWRWLSIDVNDENYERDWDKGYCGLGGKPCATG